MLQKAKAPLRVRITGCSRSSWWYASAIGQEFDVVEGAGNYEHVLLEDYEKGWNYTWRHIDKKDCVVVKTVKQEG